MLEFLVIAAALKEGAHIDQLKIKIDNPDCSISSRKQLAIWRSFLAKNTINSEARLDQINRWKDYLDSNPNLSPTENEEQISDFKINLIKENDGSYVLSVFNLCECILNQSTDKSSAGWVVYGSYVCGLIMTSILYFGFVGDFHLVSWTIAYIIFASFVMFTYFQIIFIFLCVAIIEFARTAKSMEILRSLLRVSNLSSELEISFMNLSSNLSSKLSMQGEMVLDILSKIRKHDDKLVHRKMVQSTRMTLFSSNLNMRNPLAIRDKTPVVVSEQTEDEIINSSDEENEDNQMLELNDVSAGQKKLALTRRNSTTADNDMEIMPRLSLKYVENLNSW